jgi:hypothetical protein
MAEKVAKLGIKREDKYMYYVKDGAVWRVPRKMPGEDKGKPEMLVQANVQMDLNYLYFLDSEGDISRAARAVAPASRSRASSSDDEDDDDADSDDEDGDDDESDDDEEEEDELPKGPRTYVVPVDPARNLSMLLVAGKEDRWQGDPPRWKPGDRLLLFKWDVGIVGAAEVIEKPSDLGENEFALRYLTGLLERPIRTADLKADKVTTSARFLRKGTKGIIDVWPDHAKVIWAKLGL